MYLFNIYLLIKDEGNTNSNGSGNGYAREDSAGFPIASATSLGKEGYH